MLSIISPSFQDFSFKAPIDFSSPLPSHPILPTFATSPQEPFALSSFGSMLLLEKPGALPLPLCSKIPSTIAQSETSMPSSAADSSFKAPIDFSYTLPLHPILPTFDTPSEEP